MKRQISTIAIALCSIVIASCDRSQINAAKETQPENITPQQNQTPTKESNTPQQASSGQPTIGKVKSMTNGDLLCYVVLVDENEKEHNVGADFDICANEKRFLNKKVRADYEIASVSDCESIEPCGKTRKQSIITKMETLE